MNELRWILLAAGVVLVVGIYVFDRLRRPATREYPSVNREPTLPETTVPQLDEALVVRPRAREFTPPIISGEAPAISDDLPVIRVDDVSPMPPEPPERNASPRREPSAEGLSTGAFIAAQASEPVLKPTIATVKVSTAPQAQAQPVKRATSSRKIVALRLSAGSNRVDGSRLKSMLEAAGLSHGKYSIYHRLHGDAAIFSVASMVEPGTFDPSAMSGAQFPGVTLFTQIPGPLSGREQFDQMLNCARELEQSMGGILQDDRGLPLTEQREQRLRDDVADFEHLLGSA